MGTLGQALVCRANGASMYTASLEVGGSAEESVACWRVISRRCAVQGLAQVPRGLLVLRAIDRGFKLCRAGWSCRNGGVGATAVTICNPLS